MAALTMPAKTQKAIVATRGITAGDNINHHDQVITPTNFNTIKMVNNIDTLNSPKNYKNHH